MSMYGRRYPETTIPSHHFAVTPLKIPSLSRLKRVHMPRNCNSITSSCNDSIEDFWAVWTKHRSLLALPVSIFGFHWFRICIKSKLMGLHCSFRKIRRWFHSPGTKRYVTIVEVWAKTFMKECNKLRVRIIRNQWFPSNYNTKIVQRRKFTDHFELSNLSLRALAAASNCKCRFDLQQIKNLFGR